MWIYTASDITTRADGYQLVTIDGERMLLHRVVWENENGAIPEGMVIDHIDRNPSNNDISNLRLLTHRENLLNRSPQGDVNAKVKVRNVHLHQGKYRVMLKINGKTKCFGCYKDIELAELVAREARAKHYGEEFV